MDNDVFQEIADVIGVDKTRRLVELFGGVVVYIPKKPGPGHWLVEAIGQEDAHKLGKAMTVANTGVRILIPTGHGQEVSIRRAAIEKLLLSGYTVPQVALRMKIHARTVFRHRQRLVKAGKLKRQHGRAWQETDPKQKRWRR